MDSQLWTRWTRRLTLDFSINVMVRKSNGRLTADPMARPKLSMQRKWSSFDSSSLMGMVKIMVGVMPLHWMIWDKAKTSLNIWKVSCFTGIEWIIGLNFNLNSFILCTCFFLIAFPVYRESEGSLEVYNVWCSLVEESVKSLDTEALRILVI